MVKTITRVVTAVSLAAIAWAHLYDMMLTIMQRQYLEEQRKLPDIPVRP